ncbi:helix-turn-helix protein [Tamaricihabitans halophyticus]|uniref:Helix-turn-helix protein n=1 Tax=Tamaricihabitans halophyticus TaxID=1262583 RepID=A0A4R2QTB7_9PSEU|nr:helix-turn-helix protein [Tamaricihabitans halophyticus]
MLDHPRAHDVFTVRVVMRAPWAVAVRDRAALTLAMVTSGQSVLRHGADEWTIRPGDVVLVRGPDPYLVGDLQGSEPIAVIGPDQRCTSPEGVELHQTMTHGLRLWGNDPAGPDSVLIASYADVGEVGRLVSDVLPTVTHLPAGQVDPTLVDLLGREVGSDALGQGAVLDRLVDVLLIAAIRGWITTHRSALPGWLAGGDDPAVATALAAIHEHPERAWSVAGLARLASVSRATLAARFREQIGEPPISYLTRWRLTLARDLLADRALTLETIAERIGYGSAFALSNAFRQHYGRSPTEHRRRLAVQREPLQPGGVDLPAVRKSVR